MTRLAPTWIAALQRALGVTGTAATGALNEPTVQQIAVFQRDTMHATPTGILDDATLAALGRAHAELATGATLPSDGSVRGPWANDAAILAQFRAGSFLGVAIDQAHPLLLERLAAADAYLQQRFPGRSPEKIRQQLGVSPRFGVLRGGGSFHAKGWAIDINYDSNPWVGGQAADVPDGLPRRPGPAHPRRPRAPPGDRRRAGR